VKNFIERLLEKENLVLAGIPLMAISFAYVFELGYASALGFPTSAIRIDLLLTIRALTLTICIVFPVLFISFLSFDRILAWRRAKLITFIILTIWTVAFIASAFLAHEQVLINILLSVVAWGMMAAMYVHSGADPIVAKYYIGRSPFAIPLILCLVFGVVLLCGRANAHRTDQFSIFESAGNKYVLVASYGDLGVGVKLESDEIIKGEAIFVELPSLLTSKLKPGTRLKIREGNATRKATRIFSWPF
jgi:hypothetical protein